MNTFRRFLLLLPFLCSATYAMAYGPVLMVHGHSDSPKLWSFLGPELVKSTGGARFYDPAPYYPNYLPPTGFRTNGIYGVSYYNTNLSAGQFEPPISPVFVGATEIPPDDVQFVPFLYQQSDSLAARLATIINAAYAHTGQKVTLVCHSLGGLVAEAAIAYYGCQDKVEKLITLGTPLRGFPADFRIPTEIIANQVLLSQPGSYARYVRESLQMSSGLLYGGQPYATVLENRFKIVKPPGLTCVNVAGTLSPFPNSFLTGTNDGVVRAQDARFIDPTLATVYELPLAHMARLGELWSAPEDSLCLSDRTTQILEKEALGLNPLPRLASHLSFNFATARIRVTLKNEGGLPVTIASSGGRFNLTHPTNSETMRVINDSLGGLAGKTLLPGQHVSVDGPALNRGENWQASLTLTVNGRELPGGATNYIANIQAPEIEASVRYDFLNSLMRTEWEMRGGSTPIGIAWDAGYRIEGNATYDSVSNRLLGSLTAYIFAGPTGVVASISNFFSESFAFDLNLTTKTFTDLGQGILGKTPVHLPDASISSLRSLYRSVLLNVATNPGPFVVEGKFSALAGIQLDRPVFEHDPATEGLALNLQGKLVFNFSDGKRDVGVPIPFNVSCSATFQNTIQGLVLMPRVRQLALPGFALNNNYRHIINKVIEDNQFVVVPATFKNELNAAIIDGLVGAFGSDRTNPLPKKSLTEAQVRNLIAKHHYQPFDQVSVAVEPGSTRLRIMVDLMDDALDGGANTYVGVPDNGVAFQDRLLNQVLGRTRPVINDILRRSGAGRFDIDFKFPIPHTSLYFDYPVLGPISIGAGFDGYYYYVDYVRFTLDDVTNEVVRLVNNGNLTHYERTGEKIPPELQVLFLGPNNKTHFDFSVHAEFINQLRAYFALRIGVKIPFIGFVGYTKRWEEKALRISVNEDLFVDVGLNVYPFLTQTTNAGAVTEGGIITSNVETGVGLRFPPREIDLDTHFSKSTFIAGTLGELVLDPLFNLAKDDPSLFTFTAGAMAGFFVALAPQTTADTLGELAVNRGSVKLLHHPPSPAPLPIGGDYEYGADGFKPIPPPLGKGEIGDLLSKQGKTLLGFAGPVVGGIAGVIIGSETGFTDKLEKVFDEKTFQTKALPIPPSLYIANLNVARHAASLSVDLDPAYGDILITSVVGLNATNGVVPLSRDDLAFNIDAQDKMGLLFIAGSDRIKFTSLWVKKPVAAVRLSCEYDGIYSSRYNNQAYPGYSLQYRRVDASAFAVPNGFSTDTQTDRTTFSVDIPVSEGQTTLHAFQLKAPKISPVTLPFLVGRDTAPVLINGPYAAYSGVTSNVTVQAGTLVYRNNNAPIPAFTLEELKLINLGGNVDLVDLKPRGTSTQRNLNPGDTHVAQLYGVEFKWAGFLPPNQFPEGSYAVLATIRESSLNRKGSLLIPLIIDRTPPQFDVATGSLEVPVVSRHLALPLTWRLADNLSAVLHDVDLTYQKVGGLMQTGAVFTTPGQVLIPGQRQFKFTPDLSSIPDGVEDTYTLQFRATDVPGNRGVSSNVNFLLDTRPPNLDSLFVYPAAIGSYNSILNQSNRTLTVKIQSHEAFSARLQLANGSSTNEWFISSSTNGADLGRHRSVWVLDLPEMDPAKGLLDGVVADGVQKLSIELVDRANNTNSLSNVKTILVDRQPPVLAFSAQQTFIPAGRTVYPLALNTSGFVAGDQITSIALVNLNYFTPTSSVQSSTIRSWATPSQISAVLASGLPLDPTLAGSFLPPGYYGVEVKARDVAGNETRMTTQFAFQLMPPHLEVQGSPSVSGIAPITGVAVDPNPADRFPFRSRELYWALGANVPVPTNLAAINPAMWQKSGLYILPPRGTAFAFQDNTSGEMVSEGVLAYWNTTASALAFDGSAQATISPAGIVNSDVTLLLVVRDTGGQAWARTTSVHVDNRQTDLTALTAPGVRVLNAAVTGQQLRVDAALLRDAPLLQMVVLDASGAAVHRQTRANAESRNNLLGAPNYSLDNDFGFFAWYDEAGAEFNIRCVAPRKNWLGQNLTKGHTFYFSVRGLFEASDLTFRQLTDAEIPADGNLLIGTNGPSRAIFALYVPPGAEKGVSINYHGGAISFTPAAIDDYVQVLYESGSVIEKRFWRTDDMVSVFTGYLGISPIRNRAGLEGIIMNGPSPELSDQRALANHSGVLGHVFVGKTRTEPIAPMNILFDSPTVRPDLTLDWDLRLPNGSYAEPGNYTVNLYTIDPDAGRFHGALGAFTLTSAHVPFGVTGLRLSTTNAFNPAANGGLILDFNATRSAATTIQILNQGGQVVATITEGQIIQGRTDTTAPHQVWWDGYINGVPATNGTYTFRLSFVTDGVTNIFNSSVFAVSYPTNSARESDWGLLTQPIAFDPATRDRITRDPSTPANDRAWVTLQFNAKLADGSTNDAQKQVALAWQGGPFASVVTDTNTTPYTFIPVSPLFEDAVQRFNNIKVKFNDRVVDVFPPIDVNTNNANIPFSSRAGQFQFTILDAGPKALRLQMILRATLKPWRNGLYPILDEFNQLFDPTQVREFSQEVEFREKPGTNGVLQSLVWNLNYTNRLWGYETTNGASFPRFGYALLDNIYEIEIRDRNGEQTLARFNSWQVIPNGTSAVEQLFKLTSYTDRAPVGSVGLDLVFETKMANLQAKAASMGVPVAFGYAGINASLAIPTAVAMQLSEGQDLDPFPTRYYRTNGTRVDLSNGGQKYDNVKGYSGDSALVQEVNFSSNHIAGHIPFDYALRPSNAGNKGLQTMEIHPWVPYAFRKQPLTNLWTTEPNVAGASFGYSSSSAGDVNGDGYDDVIIGAPSGSTAGSASLYLGGPNGLRTTNSWKVNGFKMGFSVRSAGDVNGDGYADVIIGSGLPERGDTNVARCYLYLGGPGGLSTNASWTITGVPSDSSQDGYSVSGAGDVNGDGYDDVIVGLVYTVYNPNFFTYSYIGSASLYLGGPNGLSSTSAWARADQISQERFGTAVSGVGDVNGDGYADVVIGAPTDSGSGRAYLYLGGPNGLSNIPTWTGRGLSGPQRFGQSVAGAGDVNNDGFDDIVVGCFQGPAFVFLGGPNGLSTNANWISNLGDRQWNVSDAGDVNGDGYSDIVVGAVCDSGGFCTGQAWVFLGSPSGIMTNQYWSATGSGQSNSRFGSSVGKADVNGDGFSDIIIGEYQYSNGQAGEGRAYVHYFPKTVVTYNGWTRGGAGGSSSVGNLKGPNLNLDNLLPSPLANVQIGLAYDPNAKSQRAWVTYTNNGRSGFLTNAPFPASPVQAAQWLSNNFYTELQMQAQPVPINPATGQTNSGWQLNLKFAAVTNDMFIAATPDAYDAVITSGLIDYTFVATDDNLYNPTINYFSEETAWMNIARKLPGYPNFNGLPAVVTASSLRPVVGITNVVLKPDVNFPALSPTDLNLGFTQDPSPDGGENSYIKSAFNHQTAGYFRDWSLADDPNIKAAVQIQPESVRLSLMVSNFVYDSTSLGQLTNNTVSLLLTNIEMSLSPGVTVNQSSSTLSQGGNPLFVRYRNASLGLRVTRTSAYTAAGEVEAMQLVKLDLTTNRTYSVRSSRYQCFVTPVVTGASSNALGFLIGVKLDPPLEYSVRQPLRRTNSVALPLHVIDREKFWQVDSGEYVANLFKEVAIGKTNASVSANPSGYVIDPNFGYTQTNGSRILATDNNYAARANALFWKTSQGTIVKNPRIILGNISVTLKDPSGQEESPQFQDHRYVAPSTNEYFNDLYLDSKDLANLSWKAKIRPQAKEHAYIKVYGSVGGNWTLAYRRKESGQLSGLLPADSGSLTWTTIASGAGSGQNQFLTYWDITELNGAHLLRLESGASPDNASTQPEVKFLEVMLGQHLPGKNNPIFSPGGYAESASLFSMHGRTQLTSAPEDRGNDDLFFTVNPMKIEERPFSLRPDGLIPLGERVQILPHTDHSPFSLNFYVDRQEYSLYDKFRLYHQLESGGLEQITSLPPSVRPKFTLIQGYVEHTSIVGFLPNPSLRLVTLNVPRISPDGLIRLAGAVDLYGTDNSGVKNESLTVAIVVSPDGNFYNGQVKARLTTGATAEFPIAAEATQANVSTSWIPGQVPQTFHVFAVVVSTNDDWLTLNRQLTPADAEQHLFNVSQTTVTMTTNVNTSLKVAGLPVFSPNGDGVADTIRFNLDFQREGLVQLEFRNEVGQSVHLTPVTLNSNGQATFIWDGNITGQGALSVAPDGFYTVTARYADGQAADNSASTVVELRAYTKYFGRLVSSGVTNTNGAWRTLWTHLGGAIYSNDMVRIQYSESTNFVTVRGDRLVTRLELSALFDDAPANLAAFVPDTNGNLTLRYRLRVTDEVGNIGLSPVVNVSLPSAGLLNVATVSPPNGATNVSTEPPIIISLGTPSPFTAAELGGMLALSPAVPRTVTLSANRQLISVSPQAPFAPSTLVTASLQRFPGATGTNVFAWSFRVLPTNLVMRSLMARLSGVPSSLEVLGAQATAQVIVSNAGNLPARLTLLADTFPGNVLSVHASNSPVLVFPSNEVVMPFTLSVTGLYHGSITAAIAVVEQNLGAITSLWTSVSISSLQLSPTLQVWTTPMASNKFSINFSGQSQGNGPISTLARFNGGGWWLVSQSTSWSFDANFAADGDILDIVVTDDKGRNSGAYTYTFSAPELGLEIRRDLSLTWNAQLGRIYTVEWSTNLLDWVAAPGLLQQSGAAITVAPGYGVAQITDAPSGRISVRFSPAHPVSESTNNFFRIISSR